MASPVSTLHPPQNLLSMYSILQMHLKVVFTSVIAGTVQALEPSIIHILYVRGQWFGGAQSYRKIGSGRDGSITHNGYDEVVGVSSSHF